MEVRVHDRLPSYTQADIRLVLPLRFRLVSCWNVNLNTPLKCFVLFLPVSDAETHPTSMKLPASVPIIQETRENCFLSGPRI